MPDIVVHPIAQEFSKLKKEILKAHGIAPPIQNAVRRSSASGLFKKKASPKNQTRIVISGLPRSGTGVIKELIDAHPRGFAKGEVFSPERGVIVKNYVREAEALADKRRFSYFALKFLLFQSPNYQDDIAHLLETGWKLIVVKRNDLAGQCLSHYLATALNQFHNLDRPSERKRALPSVFVRLELMEQLKTLFKKANDQLQEDVEKWGGQALQLSFEEDITEISSGISKVANFLEIEAEEFILKEHKTFDDNWKLVENADSVRDIFADKNY